MYMYKPSFHENECNLYNCPCNVKVQATRKKPWEQSETAPIIWQMEVKKGREELEY